MQSNICALRPPSYPSRGGGGSVEADSEAPCPRSLKPRWRPPATTGEAARGHAGGGI